MQQWLIGVEHPQLLAFLSTLSTVEKRPWVERDPDASTWRTDTLVVFDAGFLSSRNEDLPGALKAVLLVPETLDQISVQELCLRYPFPVFYFDESPSSWSNLRSHLMLLWKETLADHRLNGYIVDSFREAVNTMLLEQQKDEIRRMNSELERLARVDYLTNLLNRRALLEAMEAEKRRALRHRWRFEAANPAESLVRDRRRPAMARPEGTVTEHLGQFSCQMVDIDHFKQVNDQHGHLVGDEVLRRFSEICREKGMFRETDVMGRYGGEEFIILLPETNLQNAAIPAERLRHYMESQVFRDHEGNQFQVTVSIGVAQFQPEERACEELISRADRALYYAKEHGRNQVVLFDQGRYLVNPRK